MLSLCYSNREHCYAQIRSGNKFITSVENVTQTSHEILHKEASCTNKLFWKAKTNLLDYSLNNESFNNALCFSYIISAQIEGGIRNEKD